MTPEERLTTVEQRLNDQGARIERHSVRLEKLERTSEDVAQIKTKVQKLDTDMQQMKLTQALTDQKLTDIDKRMTKRNNIIIALLLAVIGLIGYIAFKNPQQAVEVVEIVGKPLATAGAGIVV